MKQIEIKDLLKRDLLIIELPEKIDRCWVLVHSNHIWINNRETGDIHRVKGSYTLLGKPDEISEEDAMELVEKEERIGKSYYMNYKDGYTYPFGALKSLLSAIESVIFWDANPFSYPNERHTKDGINVGVDIDAAEAFHEAQSRTFDRKITLIFVKN